MFFGILSALALGIGVAATANDVTSDHGTALHNAQPQVQVEQIQLDEGANSGELGR